MSKVSTTYHLKHAYPFNTILIFYFVCKGAWWEVDLGEGIDVARVTIFNRNDGDAGHASEMTSRLSNSVVALLNHEGITLKTYRIGDATNIPVFDINFVGESGVLIN